MIDAYALSTIAFLVLIGILVFKKRDQIEFNYLLIMYRTKRFRGTIDKIAQAYPRFWRFVGIIGIVTSFLFMLFGVNMILASSNAVISGLVREPALKFIIPTVSSETTTGAGFIGIPFWFWIVTVTAVLIPHEFFHGIMSRVDKVRLKNVGLLLFAIIPGAFVEPDENQLKKQKLITKLRVFSAGAFINIAIGIILILLINSLVWGSVVHSGLVITEVVKETPADKAGLHEGMLIDSIAGTTYDLNFFDYSLATVNLPNSTTDNMPNNLGTALLYVTMFQHKPGENITIVAEEKNYTFTLSQHPDIENFPYMGIKTKLNTERSDLFANFFPLIAFISVLSIAIGVFNLLPLYPLDGGLMAEAVFERISKKHGKKINMGLTYFMLLLILFLFAGPYVMNLFGTLGLAFP